ncbi:hypothetical protein EPN42_02045 [bacterium]|nr:MAG: hypothetical protein EPN42_02045 [bacterium]
MTPHAIAGWATVAVVVGVVIVLAVYAAALALRVRRIQTRFQHPLLQRILATNADLRNLQNARVQIDELSRRAAQALASLRGDLAQRERLRREGGRAIAGIVGNLRTIRDLLT